MGWLLFAPFAEVVAFSHHLCGSVKGGGGPSSQFEHYQNSVGLTRCSAYLKTKLPPRQLSLPFAFGKVRLIATLGAPLQLPLVSIGGFPIWRQ